MSTPDLPAATSPQAAEEPPPGRDNSSSLLEKISCFVAEGLGSGRIHPAPGTWGTLAAVLFGLGLGYVPGFAWWWLVVASVVAFLVGLVVIPAAERRRGCHDPGSVVIDEWAGVWPLQATLVATMAAWPHWLSGLVAFVLFRIVDIWKPGPVRWSERIPGAWGVMVDDMVAGLLLVGTWLLVFMIT